MIKSDEHKFGTKLSALSNRKKRERDKGEKK